MLHCRRPVETGCHHPLTAVVEQIEDVFIGMGYEVAEGTEVEKTTTTSKH